MRCRRRGGDLAAGSLTLVVATDLGMSAGKALAQIGHAALMADLDPDLAPPRRRRDGRGVGRGSRTTRLRSCETVA